MILRVERDGVEFFVDTKTGDTGISISGLARLCGVSQSNITRLLQRLESLMRKNASETLEDNPSMVKTVMRKNGEPVVTKNPSKSPEDNPSKDKTPITENPWDLTEEKSQRGRGRPSKNEEDHPASLLELLEEENLYLTVGAEYKNAKVIREAAIAKLVEYYALDTKTPTPAAQNALRQFNRRGVKNWIYDIVNWQPAPPVPVEPKTRAEALSIEPRYVDGQFDRHVIYNLLTDKKMTAAMYRVYFYLVDCHLMNHRPSHAEVSKNAQVAKHNLYDLIERMRPLCLVPDWFEVDASIRTPEAQIRSRLQAELGGQIEVQTMHGPIDLVTATELIEIKKIEDWKEGFGQILAKSPAYPRHQKRLHLFGSSARTLRNIDACCAEFEIKVSYEAANLAAV
jgi:hypothetical protein